MSSLAGIPNTWGEAWDYLKAVIGLLKERTADSEVEVSEPAIKALSDAIHPLLENEAVRDALFDALAQLPREGRRRVWTEVNHLNALFDRVDTPEFSEQTNTSTDVAGRRAGLTILMERLRRRIRLMS